LRSEIISKLDRAAVGAYCDAYSRGGNPNPAIRADLQSSQWIPHAVALPGDSAHRARSDDSVSYRVRNDPSSRSRVKVANPKQKDLFEQFLDLDADDEDAG
jgi:hypothetical protein